MAQTKEEAKIKRLENQVKLLKDSIKGQQDQMRRMEAENRFERQWRMDFQKLVKEAVQSDTLDEKEYW